MSRQGAVQRRLIRLAAAMNTKARRIGARGRVSAEDLAIILVESEGQCAYCSIDLDPLGGSFDHVISFDRGGDNLPPNIVRSCYECNRTKAANKTPEDLAAYAALQVQCRSCGRLFRPRWADWVRGLGKTCSRACAGRQGGRRASA